MKRLLLTLIVLALTIITVDAAAATVCHAEWLPDDTQTKTIEEGDTAAFQWYATTNYDGLDATIKLYKGNDAIHTYDPGTLGGSYAGGEQDVTTDHYQGPGDYEVLVKCSDTWGFTYQHSIDLTVEEADHDIISVQATADPSSGEAPLQVELTCTAEGGDAPLTYSWDLGDGDTATGSQLTHTYSEGSYEPTCTVTDQDGDSLLDSATVTVTEADVDFTDITVNADPEEGDAPLTTDLTCTAEGGNDPVTYSWDLGDGQTATGSSVTHTYQNPSTYNATCTAEDADGDEIEGSVAVAVSDPDVPIDSVTVTADPDEGEDPLTTDLTCTAEGGNAPLSYSWDLDDGQTASGQQLSHTYSEGSYEPTCTVTDQDGDSLSGSATVEVSEPDVPIDSVTVTADPDEGEDPLTTDLTCTAEGGNAPLSYSWDLDDGTSASGSQLTHTYSEGSYEPTCTVTDVDGDSLSDSATVTVTEADVDFTDITVNADPEEGDAPLTTDLTCTAEGGNDPVTYSWDLGDGQTATGSSVTHTYQNPGAYNATCTAEDADGDTIEGTVTVTATQANRPPVMQPVPDQEVPEEQAFSYSLEVSDPDGDELECYAAEIPSWLSLDEDGCELYGTAPGVEDDKRYDVTVGVEDPEGLSDEESFTITVLDDEELLVIDEFGCNPDVVQGERQYCSAKVTDDEGALVEDADVTMSYHAPGTVEGALFADCTTNEKGYCAVDPVINEEPGDYTVEAVATKQGYGDSAPIYDSFTVWEQRYKIKDFDVYDDESFSNPEDEFFRGDAMYSSFAIYDLFENEYVCDDSLVKDVFLRVYNEEPLPFEEWEELQKLTVETVKTSCVKCAPCEYRYWLESIPLSDDYLGDGRVFAFAFNFTDGTAGQASKEVTVLNNPVSLDLPSEVVISKYEAGDSATETLDLADHADDLETSDGDLEFAVESIEGIQGLQASIAQGVLTLTAPSGVTGEGTITIGVDDTDGSTAEDTMDVEVTVDFVPEPPVADAGPDQTAQTGETVGFDGSGSYDPDGGDITSYEWDFGNGDTATGATVQTSYDQVGDYTVTLTVTDDEGDTDTDTADVTVSQANRPPVMQPVADQETPEEDFYSYELQVSDPDGDELECYAAEIPSWLSLDEDGCELYGTAPGVEDDEQYDVTVGVEDPEGLSDEESFTITVTKQPFIVIDEAGCNPDVVRGHRQYCSAHVTDDDGEVLEGAEVAFSYDDGDSFGACTTNEKGYCAVDPVIDREPGVYTAGVAAEKDGYVPAQPEELQFRVWEQRYEIRGLEVYDDDEFSNPEDEFFRGDAMYSSFAIYDLIEERYVCDDSLVKDVFLRVYNEEPLPFDEWQEMAQVSMKKPTIFNRARGFVTGDKPACEYRYWLESIPLSDDYLGDGRVFAFAFNFTDGTAGQASKEVTVLNNPVTLDLPSEVVLSKYEAGDSATETLDLEAYADDLETPDGELVFDVFSTQGLEGLQYGIDDGVLTLTAPSGVTGEGTITIGVDDTDGSTAEDTMDVEVTVDFVPEPPVADAGPDRTVETGETVGFDGGDSYDPDGGDITSYEWDFGNGDTATGVQASAEYDDEGDYTVTLTVTDDEGDTDTDTAHVTVSREPYVPACSNGKDDDGDGLVDMEDPGCSSPSDPSEYNRGSSGPESGLTVASISTYGEGGYERAVPGDIVTVEVVLQNRLDQDLEDLRVTYKVPWLGVKQRGGQFSLDDGERHTETLQVYLPWDAELGEHYTEISVSNGDLRRSLHRMLEVTEG